MNRRNMLKTTGAALGAASLSRGALAQGLSRERLRIGVIGVGERGRVLLAELLKRDDVEVRSICDIDAFSLELALNQVATAERPVPAVFTGDDFAWREMLSRDNLDAVIIATPWRWHAPMAIGAMQAGVAVGCEVVAGITLQDHWDVLATQQRTGTPYMLLENVCYRRDVMAVLNMVRQDLFGEIIHLEGGYQHDLRRVKFNSGVPGRPYEIGAEFGEQGWSEARWRTQHSVDRNGDIYPSHGIGPCAMWARINRGNRFTHLTSYASKSRGLHNYVVAVGGAEHPNAQIDFRLGDVVSTMIACHDGTTVQLSHDTNLPRPYSLGFRVQGEKGLWMDVSDTIYIEGQSPQSHEWEAAQQWLTRYEHPLWQTYAEQAIGAGHGGMDFFAIHGFVEAVKRAAPMPIDIYDAVTWSAITPLSEASIAAGNRTVDFPDFTDGAWQDRDVIFALDGSY